MRQKIRFLIVGFINTVVGYGAYILLAYLGLHYNLAYTLSTIIGVTNSYIWNKYYTFQSKEKSVPEVIRFVCVYAVGYVINLFVLDILVDKLGVNQYIAGFFTLIVTTIISYVGHKFFSFKNMKR